MCLRWDLCDCTIVIMKLWIEAKLLIGMHFLDVRVKGCKLKPEEWIHASLSCKINLFIFLILKLSSVAIFEIIMEGFLFSIWYCSDCRNVLNLAFGKVSKEYYAPALGGIMLSIGIRLSIDDFALAFKRPLPLSVGYIAQYVLKPVLGLLIAKIFRAPSMFYAGFILTCCVAGAQLSSYASFLSKGDVALSILLTSSTTISSVLMTPLLTGLLIGSVVPVDGVAMSKSILQVVLVPVALGLVLNTYAKAVVNLIQPIMPFFAMACTSLCIGSPLAINRNQILSSHGLMLLFPILTFHLVAFVLGYWFAKFPFLRQDESVCRTISLCTGMQSSTLAGLLATQFLGSTHAVPAACSVVLMAIMGLCLASFWGNGSRIRDIALLI
ncbi:Sodium Bile acid symporter family [Musa troglodytarum]|uniref:Sodium Bile acid symporter family n=1 Tax=Musa troglodytarum TaxID=320322 RepID=A0A9E7EHC6_9LILI|nr:Sodium Bile acid symporter family [Musa troglodytarum]